MAWHNRIRDALAALLSALLLSSVNVEQLTPEMVADRRHPDIDFYEFQQKHKYIDVEICTPHVRSLPGEARLHKADALIEN